MVLEVRSRFKRYTAIVWLCTQLLALAAAPTALFTGTSQAATDAASCTCVHTGATECPMHHPKPQKGGCECRGSSNPDTASLVSLLGPIAVLASAPAHLTPPALAKSLHHKTIGFVGYTTSPDGPPPRA